ncbi:MAG: hypothetical protein ACYC6M_14245 [Terriglobales bacterium]
MSTLTVADIPLDADSPAQRLRRIAAAVRVSLHWWGTHRALTSQQKQEVSAGYAADVRFLTAGKKILDVRHEAFRRLTSIRTRIGSHWRGSTLPYVEAGVRLIRQSDIEAFVHSMEGFRDELTQAEAELDSVYEDMKADAQRRLGRLYNAADYPPRVQGLFGIAWDFPSVEPPAYLLRISPEIYEQERQRLAARFEEAVRLAEQAFAAEFARLLSHLAGRLEPGEQGERRVFRDSAVTNLREFFARFEHLNVRSSPELDALVAEAQRLVQGLSPRDLRDDAGLRAQVALDMAQVQARVEGLLIDAPRRRLVRNRPSAHGESHAVTD